MIIEKKVHKSCFYEYNKNYYSVPQKYIFTKIKVIIDGSHIWEFYDDFVTRKRSLKKGKGHYYIKDGDFPYIANHRDDPYLNRLIYQSRLAGENIFHLNKAILNSSVKHPYSKMRTVELILYLVESKGCHISNIAAEWVLLGKRFGYWSLKIAIIRTEKEFKFRCKSTRLLS